jgi:formylglycine-generating enzyme required for sulfatase activity
MENANLHISEDKMTVTLGPEVGLELLRIPAGEFRMGSDGAKDENAQDDELPQHRVSLGEYWIGKNPVTVDQYGVFAGASGWCSTAEKEGWAHGWTGAKWEQIQGANWRQPRGAGSSMQNKQDHPVTCVSWDDASEYCKWLSRITGKTFRLPSEAEWEKAARGTDRRLYPWGSQSADEKRCNFKMNVMDTTPVGKYSPQGDSPYGCADMAGNVWEWTHSLWKEYPYRADDEREEEGSRELRVLRGGSFYSNLRLVRCAFRFKLFPDNRYSRDGFRVSALT